MKAKPASRRIITFLRLWGWSGPYGAVRTCQQSASNPASHSLASHELAIEASAVYVRLCDVKGSRAGR